MPTLTELAHKGSTVTFIVPDRVKGGEQATSHRKLSIKYILRELYAAGVEKKDILFIISNGLHPRSKESDAKAIFGEELFNEFWHTGQIISHDSEDQEHMVYLGKTHTPRCLPWPASWAGVPTASKSCSAPTRSSVRPTRAWAAPTTTSRGMHDNRRAVP